MLREPNKSPSVILAITAALLGLVTVGCVNQSVVINRLARPPVVSQQKLYQLAVNQYTALFDAFTEVEIAGGAAILPEKISQYMMDPAWSAFNETYSSIYRYGDRYVGTPQRHIDVIINWVIDNPPDGTLVAVATCEVTQGAAMVTVDGDVLQDGSPVIVHRRGYFKYDNDGLLKAFIVNGEVVSTCPIG